MLHPLRLLRRRSDLRRSVLRRSVFRRSDPRRSGFVACTECGTEVPADLAFRQGDVIACSVLCLADSATRRGGYLRD